MTAVKKYGLIALILVTSVLFTSDAARSVDVLDFVAIPAPPNAQARVDVMLACQNGVAFGFNAEARMADFGSELHPWDISFAGPDGLLIEGYPLALAHAAQPLQMDGSNYPYRSYQTLLWGEPLEQEQVAMCLAGADTGFCEVPLPLEACLIRPEIVAQIGQVAPGETSTEVGDQLVFEVRTYDPAVGTANGDGIDAVRFQILDYARSLEMLDARVEATADGEAEVRFCAFSPECAPWNYAAAGATWPDGEPLRSGSYLLRATVYASDGGRTVVQQEIELTHKTPPQAVPVAGGEISLGSTSTSVEAPVHSVTVGDFWMTATEITFGQYRECVEAFACTKPQNEPRWNNPAYANHPVANISWRQANEYARWLGGRLPTEAEWEAACRGGEARVYPWGDDLPTPEQANFNRPGGGTMPVGSYPAGAGAGGLLDLSGNVWEWTSSGFAPYPYAADDGREEARSTGDRTVRGGSFYYTRHSQTCSTRAHYPPDTANEQIGLRVIFDTEPLPPAPPQAVRILTPEDGATVSSPVEVTMAAEGLIIEEAGEVRPGAGHFHLLIDVDFVAADELIPFADNHLHFGDGSTTAQVELAPGQHTLRLQFANGAHVALAGEQYRDEITITVE